MLPAFNYHYVAWAVKEINSINSQYMKYMKSIDLSQGVEVLFRYSSTQTDHMVCHRNIPPCPFTTLSYLSQVLESPNKGWVKST